MAVPTDTTKCVLAYLRLKTRTNPPEYSADDLAELELRIRQVDSVTVLDELVRLSDNIGLRV